MAVFNANTRFRARRAMSTPIVKVPRNVREAFNICELYRNGMAKLEPGKQNCLYDRCYIFEEINYINKDEREKELFLNMFMGWLRTMNLDFKITLVNEYQSISEFLSRIRVRSRKEEYPKIEAGMEEWIDEKLDESNPNVNTVRCLTVSCRAETLQDAQILLNALDTTMCEMFRSWQGKIIRLNGEERLLLLHSLLRVGKNEEEEYLCLDADGRRDWKNDLLPKTLIQESNFMKLDDIYMCAMFGWKYHGSLESDSFIRSFSHVEFPSFLTMDYAPVSQDIINDKLSSASMNNDRGISEEAEKRQSRGQFYAGPSYRRQRQKDELENLHDQVNDNDETGYFTNLLVVVTAFDEMTLAKRVKQIEAIGKKEGVTMTTSDYQQLKTLNTALPYGGRQVDFMRIFLSSSAVAFQPYYAQDIIEPGGYMYGLNTTTKRLIFGNRKLLMNPHGIIIGHTGSGKSVIIKMTEILQTLLSTDDDILILDPQNETKSIVEEYGGSFFDLTPKSKIYLNGFEVSDEVFHADHDTKERFIATQTKYAKSLTAALMNNIIFTQEHASIVGRCCRKMFDHTFAQRRLKKQPTLRILREEIRKELGTAKNPDDAHLIRQIYNCMEEYTEGSCDMLSRPSTIQMDNRMIGFGLKNVPEDNWEAVMITIMHYTSSRMEYNQKLRRATHFIVDETQVVSRKGTSADQLNSAVATFRKFGGICTMAMQNLTAALGNEQLKELFSNCSYKCFLDQGGVDARALAEIQELSQTEFNALSSDEVGTGVMVWGKKVVLFDAKISKENTLYPSLSTNFYEKKTSKVVDGEDGAENPAESFDNDSMEGESIMPDNGPSMDRLAEIILQMASVQPLCSKDILSVVDDISQEEVEKQIRYLCKQNLLEEMEDRGQLRYRKVV